MTQINVRMKNLVKNFIAKNSSDYFSSIKKEFRNKYDTFIITSGDPQLEDN